MFEVLSIWFVLAIVLFAVVSTAIWSRKETRARLYAVLSFVAAVPISALILISSLGRPVPMIDYISKPSSEVEVEIIGFRSEPGVGIYVLVGEDFKTPTFYFLPWSGRVAADLEQAKEEAQRKRTQIRGKFKDSGNGDSAHSFYSTKMDLVPFLNEPPVVKEISPDTSTHFDD